MPSARPTRRVIGRGVLFVAILACVLPTRSFAQAGAGDSVILRAQQRAASGDTAAARATIDSLLERTLDFVTRSNASYWRARYSATPAERERALTQFVVEYPLSRHTGSAQFELAMLELAHSDRDRAATNLAGFLSSSPTDSNRTVASLSLARILFDRGELSRGCAVTLAGRAEVPAAAIETRNQFDFLAGPCAGVDTSVVIPPAHSPDSAAVAAPRSPLGEYTVQVAAYDTRAQADRLATRLRGEGFEARVVGTKKPFRVRVGHYATHTEAVAASKKIEDLVKLKPFVLLAGPED